MDKCIIIPVYKEFNYLSKGELSSLMQVFRVLKNYDLIYVGGNNFNFLDYQKIAADNEVKINIQRFETNYFESVNGYNRLMTSIHFYRRFQNYQFMLIYQLDSYVFRNELEYWCQKGFDYIGAPWFEGFHSPTSKKFIGVGNGGFSLRHIGTYIKVLRRIKKLRALRSFWYKSKLQSLINFENIIKSKFLPFKIRNIQGVVELILNKEINYNEDGFWAIKINEAFMDFRVAEIEEAIKFSMEVNPSFLFAKNKSKLPFGCHAWEKYEPEFWKNYIEPYQT